MGRKPWSRKIYPSFFKILLDDFPNKLQIPVAFAKNFDGEASQQCLIWNPFKKFWNVNVEKTNNRLFFQKGWNLFLLDNGLEFGDLLVFHYNAGKSEFYVDFYGKNCCQKRGISLGFHREKDQSENSLDGNKTNMVNIGVIDLETEDSEPIEQYRSESSEDEFFEEKTQTKRGGAGRPRFRSRSRCDREVRALEEANKYIPKHPSFKLVMAESYVMKGLLGVPISFYRTHMKQMQRNGSFIMLQHLGKSWPVKFCINEPLRARFASGWGKFVKDNTIELGDVCVFELMGVSVVKVSIFRG
ncbi:B3 domain-containing transcription factor VRN1-like isoform X2 [Humulus lupulus]|uniref:B3 domain-containing transcription factor VRN1-like isoform X2 n=1 Tax=Humulus lupulus TaxID=3486 RepID=UPI002B40D5F0|nr:B3 domain-containing transcription factor VRN1-like isoform X2 [Humulus lupulus]